MPRAAPDKPKQETWLDWIPPGEPLPEVRITREELIKILQDHNVGVDEPTLRLWERTGVLPRTIRERRGNANHAVYPLWMLGIVQALRYMQFHDMGLEAIGPALREAAPEFIARGKSLEASEEDPFYAQFNLAFNTATRAALKQAVARYAEIGFAHTGRVAASATVQLFDHAHEQIGDDITLSLDP